jgi:hypothetical protein
VNQSTGLAVLTWLACVLVGTCTLGVVALERAADPVHAPIRSTPLVALIELAGGTAGDTLAFWERSAHAAGLRAERVAAARLADVSPDRFGVWVLAQQPDLTDADWAALDAFALRGGGVVLADPAQAGAADAMSREPLTLRRLFPGHRFELRADAPDALRVAARGVVSAGLAAGERLALLPERTGPHLATTSGGALVWGADEAAGAVLAGLHRGAPAVWLGCPLDWLESPEQASRLAVNALRFAAREALIEALVAGADGAGGRGIQSALAMLREGELRVSARNPGPAAAHDVTLRIYLPVGAPRPALQRDGWFARRPLVRYASGHAWMELVLRELDPGASIEYTLLF